jgi:hypothetical protein
MSALGHKRTFRDVRVMSVLHLKADMFSVGIDVCVPVFCVIPNFPSKRTFVRASGAVSVELADPFS